MPMLEIRRISVWSCARVCAFVTLFMSLVLGGLYVLVASVMFGFSVFSLTVLLTVLLTPVFSALSALVFGACLAFSYNTVVPRLIAPLVLHVEQTKPASLGGDR